MTPEQIIETINHIFDVEGQDGTITQVAYTVVVTKIVEKNKYNPKKHCLKLIMTLSTIMMKAAMMIKN